MTGCEKYIQLISQKSDGEISGSELEELQAHLEICPECRKVEEAFAAISDAASNMEMAEPPADLTEKIMDEVRGLSANRSKIRKPRFIRYGAVAACFVVLCIAGVKILPSAISSKGADGASPETASSAENYAEAPADEGGEDVCLAIENGDYQTADAIEESAEQDSVENMSGTPDEDHLFNDDGKAGLMAGGGFLNFSFAEDEAEEYLSNLGVWENAELMNAPEAKFEESLAQVAREYSRGFAFLDIDLDGIKELAVQVGGDNISGCTTMFYKLVDGVPELMKIFGDELKIAAEDLRLFTDEETGEQYYIHIYTLVGTDEQLIELWSRLVYDENKETYEEKELLRKVGTQYYVSGNKADETTFNSELKMITDGCPGDEDELSFILWEDWTTMDNGTRLSAMVEALTEK